MDSLQKNKVFSNKALSFYNMVQAHKNLHKHYLAERSSEPSRILNNYIPFYTEIETITLSKESIFHQLKEFKTNIYYDKLWGEICKRMNWPELNISKAMVVDMIEEKTVSNLETAPVAAASAAMIYTA